MLWVVHEINLNLLSFVLGVVCLCGRHFLRQPADCFRQQQCCYCHGYIVYSVSAKPGLNSTVRLMACLNVESCLHFSSFFVP